MIGRVCHVRRDASSAGYARSSLRNEATIMQRDSPRDPSPKCDPGNNGRRSSVILSVRCRILRRKARRERYGNRWITALLFLSSFFFPSRHRISSLLSNPTRNPAERLSRFRYLARAKHDPRHLPCSPIRESFSESAFVTLQPRACVPGSRT